ncbi:RNase P modulator RnpM [Peptostreptococcus faecalis]|uniref:RNase P modulator RnpM n=1 Tax=Peptostreptococcus faecalis TaxID=2045015 RepID=UPI0015E0B872|nr:YlxR family protein [Peptostreptococcus faecalis]
MIKTKKIPQRKCIACQTRGDKKGLIRIVKNKEGQIFLDPSGKANGRGAYVCATKECLEKAIKTKALNRAFRVDVEDDVYSHLIEELEKYENEDENE